MYNDPNCLPLRHGISGATQADSEVFGVFDQPIGDFNHFHPWHRQPERQTKLVASISFASTRMCWGLFWNLVT